MDKVVELIVTWVQKNFKNPKFYFVLAIFIVIIALVFPYIDANFFYYSRMEQRVSILKTLSEIDVERVSQSPALLEEYNSILSEVEKQRELTILGSNDATQATSARRIDLYKFISGGMLAWLITICVPFMNTFEDRKTKSAAFILLLVFGAILGWVGYIIPTMSNPWINYIGFPILQLIALIALLVKSP